MLAEEGRGGPSAEEPERDAPRRPRPAGQRGLSPNVRPSRLSPARMGGRWAAALSHEPSGVLEHSGFGRQLLSMRLGEAGAGLSLGAHACDRCTVQSQAAQLRDWPNAISSTNAGHNVVGYAHMTAVGAAL